MKGLLLKDWYMLLKYGKAYMFICIVFAAVSLFGNGNTFFVMYPMVFAGLIPVTLIAYDERSGWMSYSGTFPYSRKQIVSVKYIYAFAIWAAAALLMFAAQMVSRHTGSGAGLSYMFLPAAAVGLVPPALMLPIVFMLGSEKGRIAYMGVIILICAMIPLLSIGAENTAAVSIPAQAAVLAAVPASLILFAASWLISIKVFERREYI